MIDPAVDVAHMRTAMLAAAEVRGTTAPNPWVGAALVAADGQVFTGATQPYGGAHAEIMALRKADDAARGATIYSTLEPCCFTGRTGPCTEALIEAGVARVVVGIVDPDVRNEGAGIERLRAAGVDVEVGIAADEVAAQLEAYLWFRTRGRPFVTLKLAASLDGRTAAPDGSSQWITGHEARVDVHRLRAEVDGILVGAGTVRADNPSLDVRHVYGTNPTRVVLGVAPADAAVHPCIELSGPLPEVLDELARLGIVDLLVEGGAQVAADFHRHGLVNRYLIYLAPVLFGGDDGRPVFAGPGAATIDDVWRGQMTSVRHLGDDIAIEIRPQRPTIGGS